VATPTFANASVRSFGEARSTTGSVRSESVAMYSFSRVDTCSWNIGCCAEGRLPCLELVEGQEGRWF
jgi:hypothetical protein